MFVGSLIYSFPESPSWFMDRGDFKKAFESMAILRGSELHAARDLFLAWKLQQAEEKTHTRKGHATGRGFLTIRRN